MTDDEVKSLLRALASKIDAERAENAQFRADIRSDVDALRTQVAVVQAGQDELRHITSANHFRISGRIDQLTIMLRQHLEGHGDPRQPAAE